MNTDIVLFTAALLAAAALLCVVRTRQLRASLAEARRLVGSQHRSESLYRAVLDGSNAGVWVADAAMRTTYVNPRLCELLGRTEEELRTAEVSAFLAWDALFPSVDEMDIWLARGHREIELRMPHPDGVDFWAQVSISPLTDDRDRYAGAVAVVRDVTADRERAVAADRLRASEERLAEAQHVAHLGSWEYDIATGTTVWSDETFRLLGLEPGTVEPSIGAWFDRVHPDDVDRVRRITLDTLATGDAAGFDVRVVLPDGAERRTAVMLRVTCERGIPVRAHGILQDVTAAREAERALRDAEEQSRLVVSTATDAFIAVDDDGVVTEWNPAAVAAFGWARDEALGRPLAELIGGSSDRAGAEETVGILLAAAGGGDGRAEVEVEHRAGRRFRAEVTAWTSWPHDGRRVNTFFRDLVPSETSAGRQEPHSLRDALTRLPNRLLLTERVARALRAAPGAGIGVFAIDLDRFDGASDSLGYAARDKVLDALAGRLAGVARAEDTVVRIGANQFVLVRLGLRETSAVAFATRLAALLAAPLTVGSREVSLATSIGVAFGTVGAAELLRRAEVAMHRAAEGGSGRIEVYDHRMSERAAARLDVETGLRHAVANGELRLYYQPVVSVATGQPVGCEALVRWAHPERGVVGPDEFIPVAEETGLIVPIGRWVLTEACTQAARWQHEHPELTPLVVSVNVSPRQFADPGLADDVRCALDASGLPAEVLCLEITESAIMEDPGVSADVLRSLKLIGVRVSIDDFGTGYSSMSVLKRLPVDGIKIDRTFVSGLDSSPEDRAIVAAVVGLAHTLDLYVVAEGAEREEQARELRTLGAEYGQGYLWSRPLPPDEAVAWLLACAAVTADPAADDAVGRYRVVVVDDSADHRNIVCRIIQRTGAFVVVGTAADGRAGVETIAALRPDLAVLDVRMPELDGNAALPMIEAVSPETQVVMFTADPSQVTGTAAAVLDKGAPAHEMLSTFLRLMDEGRTSTSVSA